MATFAGGPIPVTTVPVSSPAFGVQAGNVNVGLSQTLGGSLAQQSGLSLTGGQNVYQSQLTPLVSAGLSNQLSQTTQSTLSSVGPLTSLLSPNPAFSTGSSFTGLSNLAGVGVGALGGLVGGLGSSKIWPGAGAEGPSNYSGFMHNLGQNGPDVVFSIVPANNGPQAGGLDTAISNPTTATTLPSNNFTGVPPNTAVPSYSEASSFKYAAMTTQGAR
jgi:hypothetical protein